MVATRGYANRPTWLSGDPRPDGRVDASAPLTAPDGYWVRSEPVGPNRLVVGVSRSIRS